MANLVDIIDAQLSADTLQKLGTNLGIDPAKLKPAAATAVAATLDAVAGIGATKEGADRLLKLLPSGMDDLAAALRGSDGLQNLGKLGSAANNALFGDNRTGVVDCIASSNAISKSAAESLLNYVSPVVLGKLGKEVKGQNLTASNLTTYLSGQRSSIDKAIPAGYADCMRSKPAGAAAAAAASYAMMDEPEPAARKVGDYAVPEEPPPPPPPKPAPAPPKAPPPPPPPEPARSWNWLWWLLGLLLLLALLAWLFRACMPAAAPVVVPTETPAAALEVITPTLEAPTATVVATEAPLTSAEEVTETLPVTEAVELTDTLPVTEDVELTDTLPVTEAGTITETGVLTDAAGAVAGAAAAVAGAVGDAANAAVCTAIGGFDEIVADAPTITADTPVAEVQSYLDSLRESNTVVTTALGALEALNVDLGGLTDAFDELTTTVDGLTGDTVGDAAESINASLTQINESYTEIKTAAECE